MELKDVLGEIESDGANLVHGRLLEWALTPPLWHADAVGGVHTIRPVCTRGRCRTRRNCSLIMMRTRFLGCRLRHVPTSLSPTMAGSIGLRLGRVLDESWDGPDGSGAARLAAIPAGESPANRGVQCCCSHIQRREGRPTRRKPGCKSPRWLGKLSQIRPGGRAT